MNIPSDLRKKYVIPNDAILEIDAIEDYRKNLTLYTPWRGTPQWYGRYNQILARIYLAPVSFIDHTTVVLALAEGDIELSLELGERLLMDRGVHMAMYFVTRHQDDIYTALKNAGYSAAIQFKNLNHGDEGTQIRVMLKRLIPTGDKPLFDRITPDWYKDSYDAWWDTAPDPDTIEYYDGDMHKSEFEGEHVAVVNTVGCCGAFTVLEHNAPRHFDRLLTASLVDAGEAPFGIFLVSSENEAVFLEQRNAVPLGYYEVDDGPRVIYGMLRKDLSEDYGYWDKHRERLDKAKVVA